MKIIDGQVHIWLPEGPDRPWPAGGAARAQLPYALTYERLLAMMDEAGVDRAILVPPSWEGDRNDHALAGAASHPGRFAVMGRLALDQPDNANFLKEWKKQPGMLGIRQTFVLEREREWMRNGTTDWFWAAAEAANVPVMMHATGLMSHLSAIAETAFRAERSSSITLACPPPWRNRDAAKNASMRPYRSHVTRMSSSRCLPRLFIRSRAIRFRDLDEHISRLIHAFGPQRCFWGTDLSHALEKATYRQCVTHFTEELRSCLLRTRNGSWGAALQNALAGRL